MNIRETLGFHTRFKTGESFFGQYIDAVQDKNLFSGVTNFNNIALSKTHKKLIHVAQEQNILHADVGFLRALRLTDTVSYYDVGLRSIDGALFSRGTSLNLDEAVARAFGELYERTSMRFVPPNEKLRKASFTTLQNEHASMINIFELPHTTELQRQHNKEFFWNEVSEFSWVEARNFFTGEPTWIPTQLVYWGYRRALTEPILGEINTNGLGGGYTAFDAAVSGTSEVLQRHSFFSFWYAKSIPPKINVESILQSSHQMACKLLISAVLEYGFSVHLLNCTLKNGTPSVAVVLTKPGMGWFLGMSTDIRFEVAIERALCEALSIYTWVMCDVGTSPLSFFDGDNIQSSFIDQNVTDKGRVNAWSQEEVARHGSFLLEGVETQFDEILKTSISSAVDTLYKITEGQIFIKEASQPYLDEVGFHSVRIIAPKVYKLALHECFSTPVLGGVEPLNLYPHPFP